MDQDELERILLGLLVTAKFEARRLTLAVGRPRGMDVEDIVQEALLQLIADAKALRVMSAKMLRIRMHHYVRRQVFDALRKDSRRDVPREVLLKAPRLEHDDKAATELMDEIAARLSPEDRVILRVVAEGRSISQWASELGISKRAAARRFAGAIRRIGKIAESGILERLDAERLATRKQLSIIVDSSVDSALLAKFLSELAALYWQLTGGDELVIRDGKIPVGTAATV